MTSNADLLEYLEVINSKLDLILSKAEPDHKVVFVDTINNILRQHKTYRFGAAVLNRELNRVEVPVRENPTAGLELIQQLIKLRGVYVEHTPGHLEGKARIIIPLEGNNVD